MGVGYWLQAIKLACGAVLVGLVVGRWWSVWWGVFVGVLTLWALLGLFVGDKRPPSGV